MDDFATPEEERQLLLAAAGYGSPQQEEKPGVHQFLLKVVQTSDSWKVANLTEDELGHANIPLRTYRELHVFCNEVADKPGVAEYYKKKGEILAATSLSAGGFLTNKAVTQKREVANMTKRRTVNKGWFGGKKEVVEGGE